MRQQKAKRDEWGVRVKFPDRNCKLCKKYPCFLGIDKCRSNFAAYGCQFYQ